MLCSTRCEKVPEVPISQCLRCLGSAEIQKPELYNAKTHPYNALLTAQIGTLCQNLTSHVVLSLPLYHKLKTSAYLKVINILHLPYYRKLIVSTRIILKVGIPQKSQQTTHPPEEGVLVYSLGLSLPFPNLGTTFDYSLVL